MGCLDDRKSSGMNSFENIVHIMSQHRTIDVIRYGAMISTATKFYLNDSIALPDV
jgi:hypothetical protein